MNNKSTDVNDTTKPRNEIKLTGIEITEPENDETAVTVEIQVPFEFYLHGRRDLDEYERIAMEDLRIKAGVIFEHINLLGFLTENGDLDKISLLGIIEPLTKFGQGLMSAQEIIQLSFERYREGIPQPHERTDSQRQTPTAEPEEKAERLTVEERLSFDRRAVAEWLHNAGKVGTPAMKKLVGSLLTEIEADSGALDTPAHIENVLLEYDKMVSENPDDEKAQKAADRLFDLAKEAEPETAEQFINLACSLDNPDDEITVRELSGHRLASVISEVLENRNLPDRFYETMMDCLKGMHNSVSPEHQEEISETESSPDYIAKVFKYYAEDKQKSFEEAQAEEAAKQTASDSPAKFTDEDDDEKTVQIGDLGIALYNVLHNPQLPSEIHNTLMTALNDLFNDLPSKQRKRLELTEDYLADLLTYHAEKQEAEETATEQKDVLDLSEVCTEFLGTNEATAGEKRIPLASLLSAVMKHPETPKPIYEALDEIFLELPQDISERPEIIQETVNRLKEGE